MSFAEPLTVTGNKDLGVFGELVLAADGRLFNPTNTIDPNEPDNSAVSAAAEANRRQQILLDDGSDKCNPDPLPYLAEAIPPVLRDHYGAEGKDLNERIRNARSRLSLRVISLVRSSVLAARNLYITE